MYFIFRKQDQPQLIVVNVILMSSLSFVYGDWCKLENLPIRQLFVSMSVSASLSADFPDFCRSVANNFISELKTKKLIETKQKRNSCTKTSTKTSMSCVLSFVHEQNCLSKLKHMSPLESVLALSC